jgi:hypothetical protein
MKGNFEEQTADKPTFLLNYMRDRWEGRLAAAGFYKMVSGKAPLNIQIQSRPSKRVYIEPPCIQHHSTTLR